MFQTLINRHSFVRVEHYCLVEKVNAFFRWMLIDLIEFHFLVNISTLYIFTSCMIRNECNVFFRWSAQYWKDLVQLITWINWKSAIIQLVYFFIETQRETSVSCEQSDSFYWWHIFQHILQLCTNTTNRPNVYFFIIIGF